MADDEGDVEPEAQDTKPSKDEKQQAKINIGSYSLARLPCSWCCSRSGDLETGSAKSGADGAAAPGRMQVDKPEVS